MMKMILLCWPVVAVSAAEAGAEAGAVSPGPAAGAAPVVSRRVELASASRVPSVPVPVLDVPGPADPVPVSPVAVVPVPAAGSVCGA